MELILPQKQYLNHFIQAGKEYKENNITYYSGFYEDDYENIFTKFEDYRLGRNLKPDRVPQVTYWLVENNQLIGQISIRTRLNENLLKNGGNIGYGIRVPFQNKHYGTKMLLMGLEKAKELGLNKVLITCDERNIASRKVIENNGGVFENKIFLPSDNNTYRRYWITL